MHELNSMPPNQAYMQKCYNVSITGKVQDIGFRAFIEGIAKLYKLKGYVFNDVDGSVKMVCCGENNIVGEFFKEIKVKGEKGGVDIEEFTEEELPINIPLPESFTRLYTDELADVGRKLDTGNNELKGINKKLSGVDEKLFGIGEDTHNLNTLIGSFVIEQKEHNQQLEKILEKLAER